jgi:heat shock protein HtpX
VINTIKTFVLLAGMLSLLMVAGQLIGGAQGLLIGGSLGLIMTFVSFWFSDKMVLKGYHARVVTAQEAPELYQMVDTLRQRAGLPMPKVAIVPSEQPNAFATGRSWNHSVVAVTEGMLRQFPRDEIAGVIAHELAHIKNRDMLTQTVAAGIASMISVLPYLIMMGVGRSDDDRGGGIGAIAVAILAPFAAMLMQFAISRQREFAADRLGAEIAGQAKPLAQALTRIEAMVRQIPMPVAPQLAPLAIQNPLGKGSVFARMLSTHPPTEDRVRALLALDAGR